MRVDLLYKGEVINYSGYKSVQTEKLDTVVVFPMVFGASSEGIPVDSIRVIYNEETGEEEVKPLNETKKILYNKGIPKLALFGPINYMLKERLENVVKSLKTAS